jgi:hypothetical protein
MIIVPNNLNTLMVSGWTVTASAGPGHGRAEVDAAEAFLLASFFKPGPDLTESRHVNVT